MPSLAEEKRREREARLWRTRLKARLRVAAALLIVGGGIASVVWLYRSDVFEIRNVEVSGARRLSAQQVISLAAVPADATLLRVPTEAIEKRVQSSPWVAGVQVSRDFPHTLKIEVQERRPFAAVEVGRVAYIFDEQGMVLAAQPTTATMLPLMKEVPLATRPLPSQRLAAREVQNALGVLAALPQSLRAQIDIGYAASVDDFRLVTKGGLEIVFGRAEQLDKKVFVVEKLIRDNPKKIIYMDVRAPDTPTAKYAP